MYKVDHIYNLLQKNMTVNGELNARFIHSVGVAKMAVKLNQIHHLGLNEEKLYFAGLLHDCAKLLPKNELWKVILEHETPQRIEQIKDVPAIWHGISGAYYVQDVYQIYDEEIINSIYYHTTGCNNLSLFSQIIFISDYVEEETRLNDYSKEALDIALVDIDEAAMVIAKQKIDYVSSKGFKVDKLTLECYEYFKKKVRKE